MPADSSSCTPSFSRKENTTFSSAHRWGRSDGYTKYILWGKAGGRCQYDGCNKPLWLDDLTKCEFNTAYVAHIIADKPGGPRGDAVLSEQLKAELSNLMLMCDEHHRLIDKVDVDGHPVDRLCRMKEKHENRIELLTSIQEDRRSHILLYGANIGAQSAFLSWKKASMAMVPDWFPAESRAIELGLKNSSFQDHEQDYWDIESKHLQRQFTEAVKPGIALGTISHLSIFGFAPQPLLIQLGRLLSDIPAAEVYQLHREPPDWKWQQFDDEFEYRVEKPSRQGAIVALNLSFSGTIDNNRITSVVGDDASIWRMTIPQPNNDFLKSRWQLSLFRQTFRRLLNEIKAAHGQTTPLHIFPAVPVSIAVEIGRTWMPKADMPMRIYDQNSKSERGFVAALDIINN